MERRQESPSNDQLTELEARISKMTHKSMPPSWVRLYGDGMIPELDLMESPSLSASEYSNYLHLPPELFGNESSLSWSLDSRSTEGSLSHGSSPSNSSGFNPPIATDVLTSKALETVDYPMQNDELWGLDMLPFDLPISKVYNLNNTRTFESKGMERSQTTFQLTPENYTFPLMPRVKYESSQARKSPKLHSSYSENSYVDHSTDSGYHSLPQSPEMAFEFQGLQHKCSAIQLPICNLPPRRKYGPRPRRSAPSKHLERWLKANGTVPGRGFQNVLASESGLPVEDVRYCLKKNSELKNEIPVALGKDDCISKVDISHQPARTQTERPKGSSLHLQTADECLSGTVMKSDSDETDYSEDDRPELNARNTPQNRHSNRQIEAFKLLTPVSTHNPLVCTERTRYYRSSNQSSGSPAATSSRESRSSGSGKSSTESSPNSSTAESPDGRNSGSSTSGSDASTPNAISELVGFEAQKKALVNRLLTLFLPLFNFIFLWSSPEQTRRFNERGQDQDTGVAGSNGQSRQRRNGGSAEKKRSRPNSNTKKDVNGDDEEMDNDNTPNKKVKTSSPKASGDSPPYACPYFKRNRQKYQRRRGCPGPGWDSVHRVK
jgi:hypothetical protein